MKFVIQGLKYDTDKMKKIANVKNGMKPIVHLLRQFTETEK